MLELSTSSHDQSPENLEQLLTTYPKLAQAALSGVRAAIKKELAVLGLQNIDPLKVAKIGALVAISLAGGWEHVMQSAPNV